MKASRLYLSKGHRTCEKFSRGRAPEESEHSSIELHVTYLVNEHRLGGQRSQVEPQQGTVSAVRNNEGNTLKLY